MIETRLREYLEAQYDAAPEAKDNLAKVLRQGRRRVSLRRVGIAFAGAAAFVVVVFASNWLTGEPAFAASPFSGLELPVINNSPVILQGELGPAPDERPQGVDLTFTPVDKPTADDLAAIDEVILNNGWDEPVVVALGRIDAFETNVYAIHGIDTETGRAISEVVAVGPDYPHFVSMGGPTEDAQWGPSGTFDPASADGIAFVRIPEYASWQYTQLDVDGEISWQRSSDGFIWMPYEATVDSTVVFTGHDPATGAVGMRTELDSSDTTVSPTGDPSQPVEDAIRDGVFPALAALPLGLRSQPLATVKAEEGTWVASRPSDQLPNVLGDPNGEYGTNFISPSEYGELLLLNDDGEIERAYPMTAFPPSWLLITDEAVYVGRIGDGALPWSAIGQIDRSSFAAKFVIFPLGEQYDYWPPQWAFASDEPDQQPVAMNTPPADSFVQAESWIGTVYVDPDSLGSLFANS